MDGDGGLGGVNWFALLLLDEGWEEGQVLSAGMCEHNGFVGVPICCGKGVVQWPQQQGACSEGRGKMLC